MNEPVAPSFADLGLPASLLRAVEEQGYEQPTPIQAAAIPALLAGRDLLGQAQTGTGKTAAFALPLLAGLDLQREAVQSIVLAPTRELALQVAEAVRAYGRRLGSGGVRVLPVYGGQPYPIQLRALKRGVHVVIGTPGRVKDHLQRGTLDLSQVRFFGLDEADEMLNMGFIEDVEWILEQAPAERQVALFSATLPPRIRAIADRYLRDPADVSIARRTLAVPSITQLAVRVTRDKQDVLERLLETEDYEAVLVFARTQKGCGELAERLQAHGHRAESVHGGMSQVQREQVVRRLRDRLVQIVVATDVAARGLDVEHIDLVINYDIPQDEEVYVHRIGRTGRAGRAGRAITFYHPRERRLLHSIERVAGQRMEPLRVPGPAELLERRREKLGEQVRELARGGELDEFVELVEELGGEEGLHPGRIAAAALRLAWGEGPLSMEPEPEPEPERREPRAPRAPRGPGDEVELVLPVGAMNRVRPGDIVGAIAGEAKLPGSVVGAIKILERVTFVGVPAKHAEAILTALDGATIRGRVIHPRLAGDGEGRPAHGGPSGPPRVHARPRPGKRGRPSGPGGPRRDRPRFGSKGPKRRGPGGPHRDRGDRDGGGGPSA